MPHTRRVQILMEPEEYDRIAEIAARSATSVGELVRVAVRAQYFRSTEERLAAVERMAAMNLPTGDWREMKQALEESYDAGLR